MGLPGIAVSCDDSSNDDVTSCHADCTNGENRFAADAVDVEDRRNGGDEHDDADNASCEERNGDASEPKIFENGGSIVEDCVDASPLLEEPIEEYYCLFCVVEICVEKLLIASNPERNALRIQRSIQFTCQKMPNGCRTYMVTVATMTRLNMAFVLKREPIATNCNLKVFIGVKSRR